MFSKHSAIALMSSASPAISALIFFKILYSFLFIYVSFSCNCLVFSFFGGQCPKNSLFVFFFFLRAEPEESIFVVEKDSSLRSE